MTDYWVCPGHNALHVCKLKSWRLVTRPDTDIDLGLSYFRLGHSSIILSRQETAETLHLSIGLTRKRQTGPLLSAH